MNIAFFLTPKKEIVYASPDATIRQALERMEYHRYTAIPLVDDCGKYIGTLTEGDLLWKIKNTPNMSIKEIGRLPLREVPRHMHNQPIFINSDIKKLILTSKNQNFIPVVDDQEVFIGIVTRSSILDYCYKRLYQDDLTGTI